MTSIGKGKWSPETGYKYTCKNCDGTGVIIDAKRGDVECCHCYGLDIPRLKAEFKLARGARYYALWKAILSIEGKAMVEAVKARKKPDGTFTPADLFIVFMQFELPINRWKPFVEWLEETYAVSPGIYERMQRGGIRVKKSLIELGLLAAEN